MLNKMSKKGFWKFLSLLVYFMICLVDIIIIIIIIIIINLGFLK